MRRYFQVLRAAFALFFLLSGASCKIFLYLVRPFENSALRGQDPTPLPEAERAKFFTPQTLMRDVEYLASPDCDGRRTGTPGIELARAYITERMEKSGLNITHQNFTFKQKDKQDKEVLVTGINILGVLPGEDPAASWIVISAHYDHLGRSPKKGTYYPGADDNAAGVAALIALGEYFSKNPLKHNIVFAAFDAEEIGLVGAGRFLKENPIVPKENIAFNLNLDMISRSHDNELIAVTDADKKQESLRKLLFELQPQMGFKLMVGVHDRSIRALASDHMQFYFRQIPFLYLGVADHEDYHKPSDTPSGVDPRFFTAVVDGTVLIVKGIDELISTAPPASQKTK